MNSKLPRHAHTCKPYLYGGTKGKVNRSDRINGLTTREPGEELVVSNFKDSSNAIVEISNIFTHVSLSFLIKKKKRFLKERFDKLEVS